MENVIIGSCILDSIKIQQICVFFFYEGWSFTKVQSNELVKEICNHGDHDDLHVSKMSNFNSFTNLNLLCTMKINPMILLNEICKISWNKNFLRWWNCSFKGYISISFSVIIQINKDQIYSDLFIKSWFRRYICDVKIMHIKKSCSMDNCTPENS